MAPASAATAVMLAEFVVEFAGDGAAVGLKALSERVWAMACVVAQPDVFGNGLVQPGGHAAVKSAMGRQRGFRQECRRGLAGAVEGGHPRCRGGVSAWSRAASSRRRAQPASRARGGGGKVVPRSTMAREASSGLQAQGEAAGADNGAAAGSAESNHRQTTRARRDRPCRRRAARVAAGCRRVAGFGVVGADASDRGEVGEQAPSLHAGSPLRAAGGAAPSHWAATRWAAVISSTMATGVAHPGPRRPARKRRPAR